MFLYNPNFNLKFCYQVSLLSGTLSFLKWSTTAGGVKSAGD